MKKKPNGFGLFDMSGNVEEWVQDCVHYNYKDAPGDGTAWKEQNNGDCNKHMLRGGSWDNEIYSLKSAKRAYTDAGFRLNNIGFRLAQD